MNLLWICLVWPEPESSAGGVRTMQLLDFLRQQGWKIQITSACLPNDAGARLQRDGYAIAHFEPNDSRFDAFIRDLNPEIVLFDRFMIEEQFGWRVREQCPDALRVIDTCDIHSLRRLRERKIKAGQDALEIDDADLINEDSIRELSSIYRSDLSLVVSDFESEFLRTRYGVPAELIETNRIFYPDPEEGLGFEARANFVMIGNFRHAPNLDAYRFLQRELWPLIRAKTVARLGAGAVGPELHIYGSYPTKELMDRDDAKSGFRVKGQASEVREALSRYRVNLAPVRFGAGVKGKVLDGWSVGMPCVSTEVGAEGITAGLPFGGEIPQRENDWEDFAEKAAFLYTDVARWDVTRKLGATILREHFSYDAVTRPLLARLVRLAHERDSARSRNFVGAMLWHHGARSTEYFSRWIEAKNLNKSPAETPKSVASTPKAPE